ncbi:MAG: sterol desaturase family protein [Candidatus Nanoarchaeia archaeon]
MLWIALIIGFALVLLERIIPDRHLPSIKGWWLRVISLNLVQLGIVFLSGIVWNTWFLDWSIFSLKFLPSFIAGLISYLVLTFIFYWWHRVRHSSPFLWRIFHQVHHSPQRIETLTAFYKHPLEMLVNTLLVAFINYTVFGLSIDAAAWVLLLSACGEYFYHMNLRTPHWIGYIIQRPEMHCIHHKRNLHDYNYSDLPLWDILFGTYQNPRSFKGSCGFEKEKENKLVEMLEFKSVD